MKAYGAENKVSKVNKQTASYRDPQRVARRALKKSQRQPVREEVPPPVSPLRTRTHGYFVMLGQQSGRPALMTATADPYNDIPTAFDVAIFETEDEAHEVAEQNPLGRAFGFEVFEW